ncbi:uncharacterized protein LOC113272426 [Papaver somniferum]|uniref:uncharacterized protein LOC113272426 n=1 Tax=Papaver somniferum TaxID=3469 RepID=UPI000E6F505E|nr:uncharacterized protein LOC113272426 [Papaver somniferum]
MNDVVQRGQITGFKVAETGSMISHLQLADDTLIFIDANSNEVTRLFIILAMFESLTGMKLNLDKSTVISVGANAIIEKLAKELGCKTETLLIKYPGMPIGATSRCTSIWDSVLEKMTQKLASWKKKFLNKEGPLVLIKSCLASLPVYFLSLFHLPVCVEKKMIKLMRNFLWGDEKLPLG